MTGRAQWRMREFLPSILYLASSALRRRYCGSLLGFTWSLLNPVVMIGLYFLVFNIFIRVPIENYFLYLVSGLLPWMFLSNSINGATRSLIDRRVALQCSTASFLVFILADVTVELFSYAASFGVLLLISAVFIAPPSPNWLLLLALNFSLIVFVYAASVVAAYAATRFRDLPHLLQIVLTVLFWLMPIVYHWSMVPSPFSTFIQYNPLSILISPNQVLLHGGQLPTFALMAAGIVIAALASWVMLATHRRLQRDTIFYL